MRRIARSKLVMGLMVIAATGVGALMTPGLRHRHAIEEPAHSHHSDSAHVHDGHSHAHPHSHAHARGHSRQPAEPAAPSSQAVVVESHIHITMLGWQITLPDPFAEASESVDRLPVESKTAAEHKSNAARSGATIVELRSPGMAVQLLQFAMSFQSLVPSRMVLRRPIPAPTWFDIDPRVDEIGLRLEPPVPPPRVV